MKPIILKTDDWRELWVDDGRGGRKLVHEGHSLDADEVLDALGIDYEDHWFDDWYRGQSQREAILTQGGALADAIAASAVAPAELDEEDEE